MIVIGLSLVECNARGRAEAAGDCARHRDPSPLDDVARRRFARSPLAVAGRAGLSETHVCVSAVYHCRAGGSTRATDNQADAKTSTGRMFVVQQRGKILAFSNDPAVEKTDVFLALEDRDTYGMTFHPKYAENRFVYVFSNGPNSNEKRRLNRIFAIRRGSRFESRRKFRGMRPCQREDRHRMGIERT